MKELTDFIKNLALLFKSSPSAKVPMGMNYYTNLAISTQLN